VYTCTVKELVLLSTSVRQFDIQRQTKIMQAKNATNTTITDKTKYYTSLFRHNIAVRTLK